MLTPAFGITQNADCITIVIKARFAKVSDAEIQIDGRLFKFYSKPYFLRLNMPGALVEDGSESAKYNVDEGSFNIIIPKETKGEYFEGLDMLTKLLAPSGQTHVDQASIEVTDSSESCGQAASGHMIDGDDEEEDDEEIDWQVIQAPYLDDEMVTLGNACYGFANKKSGVFRRLQEELCGIVDVINPDNSTPASRKRDRIEDENEQFDEDHYLADLYEDEVVKSLLAYNPPWVSEYTKLRTKQVKKDVERKDEQIKLAQQDEQTPFDKEHIVNFSDDEKDQMRKLARREVLHEKDTDSIALISLVDIIFAYAYNHRTTEGDNTVESAWTICKLSSTLSWMDSFCSLQDVVLASYRRTISYPLYRHCKLSSKVLSDVKKIFCLGRRRLLKCLLEIHHLLSHDDPRYILNELYITEYCLWIQSVSQRRLDSVAKALKKVKVNKDDVGFELVELEEAAELVLKEEKQLNNQDSEIEQYGYPEILYTNATPSVVHESIVRTAENEMERADHLASGIGGVTIEERIVNNQDQFENLSLTDNDVVPSNISNCACHVDELLTVENMQQDGGGQQKIDITAQVVEPLSALRIASDETLTDQLDSNETECSNPSLIEWKVKPPVNKIEMFEAHLD